MSETRRKYEGRRVRIVSTLFQLKFITSLYALVELHWMWKCVNTFYEVKRLSLHVFKKEPDTHGGEVAVSHLLVSQHPLEEPLQVGLRGLQALTTPG